MIRSMDADEWYPVYLLRPEGDASYDVEVTADQVQRWETARVAFEQAQDEMGELYERAREEDEERRRIARAEREAREKVEREEQRRRQREEAEEQRRKREALVGPVYDASGKPVAVVREGSLGRLTVAPLDE